MEQEIQTEEVLEYVSDDEYFHEETLEEKTAKQTESIFESLFGEDTPEDRAQLLEFAVKAGIRDNDAIWLILFALQYFRRFYRGVPDKIRSVLDECIDTLKQGAAVLSESEVRKAQVLFADTLKKSTEEILSQHSRKSFLYELFLPIAWSCMGVFMLCLISFVGGAASAGVVWGNSVVSSILSAPAGWIIPLELIPVCGFTLYRGLTDTDKRNKLINLSASAVIALMVLMVLSYVL